MDLVGDWERRGRRERLLGHDVFVVDAPAGRAEHEPVLVLHGFPSCSFDWRHVLPTLCAQRRVVLFDFLGHGLSAKPDRAYSLFEQADLAIAVVETLGLRELALVTHDMGDSVGGELLARDLDGRLPFRVTRRLLSNGSIYIDRAQLSDGQRFLLSLPDERLDPADDPGEEVFRAGWGGTFGPGTPATDDELAAQWELLTREDGQLVLPRIIRYVDERRRHEQRWTGAIERHPSPLTVVWGDADPIAIFEMARMLQERRPDADLVRLERIGHYPMIESPAAFGDAVLVGLR